MKESDLPFDRSKHVVYTDKAKKCILKLLRRYYDEKTAEKVISIIPDFKEEAEFMLNKLKEKKHQFKMIKKY